MICVPVRAKNLKELKKLMQKASSLADIIEVWGDGLPSEVTAQEIIGMTKKPILIVNKGKKDRGGGHGTEAKRIRRLLEFAEAGADFIDVSVDTKTLLLKAFLNAAKRGGEDKKRSRIILSYHDYKKTPSLEKLKKLRDKALRAGAHYFKAAVLARDYEDNLTILRFLAESRRAGKPVIAHCMGEKGRISRILAPFFGSYIIFVVSDKKSSTAPGQFTAEEYMKISSLLNP
jgi:3-dehydroquinate dehydratase type I